MPSQQVAEMMEQLNELAEPVYTLKEARNAIPGPNGKPISDSGIRYACRQAGIQPKKIRGVDHLTISQIAQLARGYEAKR